MSGDQAAKIDRRWQKFQEQLGYTDEELAIHRSNPKHVKAMESAPKFATHRIIIEVIESQNCGAGYKVGDKFVVDSEGCLVLDQCSPKSFVAAITASKVFVDGMWRVSCDESNDVLHNTINCPDVGVH